ncbi:MAG: SapC family protein [Congregibacter sp.]
MARYEMLNNIEHRDVRIRTKRSAETGDAVQYVVTFPLELRRAQAHYPIFFQKDANTGKFYPIILLGFEEGENLYLGPDGWDPLYVPMSVLRGPFLIGYQANPEHVDGRQAVITIDMDSPLITMSREEGTPVFLEHGGSAPYLENLTQLLEDIQLGLEMNVGLVDALVDQDLIESVTMGITLNDGAERQLLGLYTINEDRLNELDGEAVAALHKDGHLQSIFMIMASHAQFNALVDRRNAKAPAAENNADG